MPLGKEFSDHLEGVAAIRCADVVVNVAGIGSWFVVIPPLLELGQAALKIQNPGLRVWARAVPAVAIWCSLFIVPERVAGITGRLFGLETRDF